MTGRGLAILRSCHFRNVHVAGQGGSTVNRHLACSCPRRSSSSGAVDVESWSEDRSRAKGRKSGQAGWHGRRRSLHDSLNRARMAARSRIRMEHCDCRTFTIDRPVRLVDQPGPLATSRDGWQNLREQGKGNPRGAIPNASSTHLIRRRLRSRLFVPAPAPAERRLQHLPIRIQISVHLSLASFDTNVCSHAIPTHSIRAIPVSFAIFLFFTRMYPAPNPSAYHARSSAKRPAHKACLSQATAKHIFSQKSHSTHIMPTNKPSRTNAICRFTL